MHSQQSSQVAFLTHGFVDVVWDLASFVPFANIGLDLGLDPSAYFVAQGGMAFVEVRGMILFDGRLVMIL
jgi:hypothetical protein